jgi:hypothetical protein
VRVRKDERAAVAALLESGDYPDADSMAEAVLKVAWEALCARETHAIAIRVDGNPDGPTLLYGPFTDQGSAKRALKRVGSGGPAAIFKVLPSGVLDAKLDVLEQAHQPKGLF